MKSGFFLAILLAPSVGLSQAPPSSERPLNQYQLLRLLAGGVPAQRAAELIARRGIDFEPTTRYVRTLREAGVEDDVLDALARAGRVKTPEARTEGAAASEAQKAESR